MAAAEGFTATPNRRRQCVPQSYSAFHYHPELKVSPLNLQKLCINVVIVECPYDAVGDFVGYEFNTDNVYLCSSLSDDLFKTMSAGSALNDESIQIFSRRHTQLTSAIIDSAQLSKTSLLVLQKHKLSRLEVNNMPELKLEELIYDGVIDSDSMSSLRILKITQCEASPGCNIKAMDFLGQHYANLVSLNLTKTKLQNDGLARLCIQMSNKLKNLDISDNPITDISPLCLLKENLLSLTMYNLYSLKETSILVLTENLTKLMHLDVSCETGRQLEAYLNEEVSPLPVERLLSMPNCLQKLKSLDVSGREMTTAKLVRPFLETHRGLEFLGLMMTPASHADMFIDVPNETSNITITSLATEQHTLTCLQKYKGRSFFEQKALVSLFQLTYNMIDEPKYDMIYAVLGAMSAHPKHLQVQMAATACLFNLTKKESAIHVECLSDVVLHVLDCMYEHPTNEQLQKNSLLTLCKDRILMEVRFDRLRCALLVMECLCKFHDDAMVRMCVAIITILASKVTTAETSLLATENRYMDRLIEITRKKMTEGSSDSTMKFALGALWNLTDESPNACRCFLNLKGVDLAVEYLKNLSQHVTDEETRLQIGTKIVGLLNNVAEVEDLRGNLIKSEFLLIMREYLMSSHGEFAYFCGGILANLLCSDHSSWGDLGPTKEHVEQEMIEAIKLWPQPEHAMVAYRCFRPFIPLLNDISPSAVKLWALWAIEHVCAKSPERYVTMLIQEEIYAHVCHISETDCIPEVYKIATRLRERIRNHNRTIPLS